MAEQKTCADCSRFKVPDSGCTYYYNIMQGTILASDPACQDFQPKNKPKKDNQLPHKASGFAEEGAYEAIYHKGKPAFLVLNHDRFSVLEKVTIDDKSYQPKESPSETPYEPYGFCEENVPCLMDLFWKVRDEFDLFLEVDSVYKDFLAACVLITYQQEKLRTVPYAYFVGDNESGKSVAMYLLNWLCYRPMLGVTIPPADTYGYLDDADAPGTILEDEAQGLYKDADKAKIYKTGYKKGSVVPRTIMMQNKRFIKYYRTFCFKACAAEEMPRVKGLLERFIFIQMVEGTPRKDWADLNKEDENRMRNTRNLLLKWRMQTLNEELPEIKLEDVKGRLKELWKPIIQITHGLPVEKTLTAYLEQLQKERLSEKTNTLEGHLVKVVCKLIPPKRPQIDFTDIWDNLATELDGKIDDKYPNRMDTPEFGQVTKQKIGFRLREALSGKRQKTRIANAITTIYGFDLEKLKRIAKKYDCTLNSVPEFPTNSTPKATNTTNTHNTTTAARNTSETTDEKTKPNSDASNQPEPAQTLQRIGSVGNTRTTNYTLEEIVEQTQELVLLTTDFGIETCVICNGKGHVSHQVTLINEQWGLLCETCATQLEQRLNKHE